MAAENRHDMKQGASSNNISCINASNNDMTRAYTLQTSVSDDKGLCICII